MCYFKLADDCEDVLIILIIVITMLYLILLIFFCCTRVGHKLLHVHEQQNDYYNEDELDQHIYNNDNRIISLEEIERIKQWLNNTESSSDDDYLVIEVVDD